MSDEGKTTTYGTPNTLGPTSERPIITTVRVEEGLGHDRVHVWNRGGKAGELVVDKGDGHRIAHRLLGTTGADR
jgi:hypothetical protein